MKKGITVFKLKDMVKGWFIGNFEPTLIKTSAVEVGVKFYPKGTYEEKHHHKLATEITVIVSGAVKMNEIVYQEGDIIVIQPGHSTDFEALTDVKTTIVKYPGAQNDKYVD